MIEMLCRHLTLLCYDYSRGRSSEISGKTYVAACELVDSNFGPNFVKKFAEDCFEMSPNVGMFRCRCDPGGYLRVALNKALNT